MLKCINAVGMSAQLLESIEDPDSKTRDKPRADLANALLSTRKEWRRKTKHE